MSDECLAKFESDSLWYPATIVDTHKDDFLEVMYPDYGEETHLIHRDDVITLSGQSGTDDSENSPTG